MNIKIKKGIGAWLALCAMGALTVVMALPARAASFDCAKAQSKVEKLICENPEISKLDEDIATLYWRISKIASRGSALRKAHQVWLAHRETCVHPDYKDSQVGCLTYLHRRHMSILRGSLPANQDADINEKQLCVSLAEQYETGEITKLMPESTGIRPRGVKYTDIDIDKDGIADRVEVDCGSGECLLHVTLSKGGVLDFGESPFYLIRYQSRIYAVVGLSEDDETEDSSIRFKFHMARLYRITSTEAELVCGVKSL